MVSALIWWRLEKWYQERLLALLAEVRRRPTLSHLVTTYLFFLADDLGNLYFVGNHKYWDEGVHFEAQIRNCKGLLADWKNVKQFSKRG